MSTVVTVDLGGGEEQLTIVVKGSSCRVEDAQLAVVEVLRRVKKTRERAKKKPCPCEEKNAG